MIVSRKKQLRYEKYLDRLIIKRDLGIKKYGVNSNFMREYVETWNSVYNISQKNTMIRMDIFFDKWNIETRYKKLKQIINNIK